MSNLVFKNELISQASSNMLRVIKKDKTVIPCSLMPKYGVKQTEKDDNVTLFNLITEKDENFKIEDIDYFSIRHDNVTENIKYEYGFVQYCKGSYNLFKKTGLPLKLFNKNFMNSTIIDYGLQDVVRDFNFVLDEQIIRDNKIPEKYIDEIKNSFLKIVDVKIDENKNELEQLKVDCEEDEDVEDINEIIDMFDLCKEEICLENVVTIKDILNEWPPLLLPIPDSLDNLLKLEIPEEDGKTQIEMLEDLLKSIDVDTLFEFKKILDTAEEKLDKTIYNDLKNILDTEYYKKFDEKL